MVDLLHSAEQLAAGVQQLQRDVPAVVGELERPRLDVQLSGQVAAEQAVGEDVAAQHLVDGPAPSEALGALR